MNIANLNTRYNLNVNTKININTLFPILAVCAGYTIWGFSYLFTRVALTHTSPAILLSLRFTIATILMTIPIVMGKIKVSFKGKNIKALLGFGLIEPVNFYFETYGILYTNVTIAGIVVSIVPVVSMLMAVVFLKEYPTKKQAMFCTVPIVGVILITISGSRLGIVRPIGLLFLILTCIASATYRILNRKIAKQYTSFERTYMILLISSVAFTIMALLQTHGDIHQYIKPLSNIEFLTTTLILSIFCSITANMLVNYSAGNISVVKLSTFGTLTTIWSSFAGVLFLKEPITLTSFIGSLLIILGIWQVTKNTTTQEQSQIASEL